MPGASSGRFGGIKRVKIVRSGVLATNLSIVGKTRGIQSVGHGPRSLNSRCMPTHRWALSGPGGPLMLHARGHTRSNLGSNRVFPRHRVCLSMQSSPGRRV